MKKILKTSRGLNEKIIREISKQKDEPSWMIDIRLKALEAFNKLPMPNFGGDLSDIDFNEITYYLGHAGKESSSWEEVPKSIKNTFEKLGIPEAERKFLAGTGAQYESEMIYHNLKKQWEALGIIFLNMSEAPRKYPELVKKYFGSLVPLNDNKFAALNTAAWSGGSFIYIPKGVKVGMPLQTYFRINSPGMGQFERTLIIADEDSQIHYIEGCTAPMYSKYSLHAAVVEVIALKNARVRYTTIQNWSKNVYNLVTKRAIAEENATIEWVDGNLGSKITMKYPAIILKGEKSSADILTIAVANAKQYQDTGAKVIHLAPNTASKIVSKSISRDGGRTSYRGLVKMAREAINSKTRVQCDALLLDQKSRSDTYPKMDIKTNRVTVEHEATVSKISEEKLYYLQSRGLSPLEASRLIVAGFLEIFAKELPLEYAVELNRLIALQMDNKVG